MSSQRLVRQTDMRLTLALMFSLGLHLGPIVFSIAAGGGSPLSGAAQVDAASSAEYRGVAPAGTFSVVLGDWATPALLPASAGPAPEPATAAQIPGVGSSVAQTPSSQSQGRPQRLPDLGDVSLAIPGPRYYKSSELDLRPQIRTHTEPEFPLYVDPGTKGAVLVRLYIDDQGAVEDVVVLRSQPEGVFDRAAVEAFKKSRFVAGVLGGKSVRSQLSIEVAFESAPLR